MTSRRLVFLALAGAVLAAGAAVARADEAAAPLAVELFNAGKELEAKGDYEAACANFAESVKLDARVGSLARLAQCEEKIGRTVSARLHWRRASELARTLHDPRAEHALREFARVDAEVPKLKLALTGPTPAGLTVTVDGTEVDAAALGALLPVTAGTHAVRARAPGRRDVAVSVVTRAGGATTLVNLDLAVDAAVSSEPRAASASGAPPAGAAPRADVPAGAPGAGGVHGGGSWQRTGAWVAGGLAVVSAGLGTYFGLRSFSQWSDAKAQCGAGCGPEDPASVSKRDAQGSATAADVSFGVAGALLAGAAALWLTAPRASDRAAPAARIVPIGGPAAAGVAVAGRFGP